MWRYRLWVAFVREISIWIWFEKENDLCVLLLRLPFIEIVYATKWIWIYIFKELKL